MISIINQSQSDDEKISSIEIDLSGEGEKSYRDVENFNEKQKVN